MVHRKARYVVSSFSFLAYMMKQTSQHRPVPNIDVDRFCTNCCLIPCALPNSDISHDKNTRANNFNASCCILHATYFCLTLLCHNGSCCPPGDRHDRLRVSKRLSRLLCGINVRRVKVKNFASTEPRCSRRTPRCRLGDFFVRTT